MKTVAGRSIGVVDQNALHSESLTVWISNPALLFRVMVKFLFMDNASAGTDSG